MNITHSAQRKTDFSSKVLLGKLECFKEKWLYTNIDVQEYENVISKSCEELTNSVADYICSIDPKDLGEKQWIISADELITEVWQFIVKVGYHHGIESDCLFWSSRDIVGKAFIKRVMAMNSGGRLAERLINYSEMYEW